MRNKQIPIIVSAPAATEVLKEFQLWRRGKGKYEEIGVEMPFSPTIIGLAIDKAIECMERMADLRVSCELIIKETNV